MSFAAQLKAERERLRITQSQAAALCGVSQSCIEKWEYGKKTPLAVTQEGVIARLKNQKTKS